MAQDSVGTARLDIVVDTSQFDVAIQRAQARTTSMSQAAQKDYAALNAAERRRVDSLIRQADTIGLNREAQIAYNAALRTSGPLLDDITRRLKANQAATQASNKELSKYGLTAGQSAAALRGVPAQITDIVTQLQGGANPLTVILQQGGQLRDMFGGIRPAAAALTGQLAAMINPTTVLAAAVGGLALAWYQSDRAMEQASEALILTGNYARLSADDIAELANELDGLGGVTSRSAIAALTQVAATGRFTGDQLELVARAAEQMRVATGRAIEETVGDFASLAKDPVEGLLKLNETQHFLTQTQLDSIRTLKEQGREQEAVTEAIRIYAETVDGRTAQVVENFGLVSGALHGIKEAAAEAWDSVITGMREADREAKEGLSTLSRFFSNLRGGPAGAFGLQATFASPVAVESGGGQPTVDSAAARKALEERKKTQQEWERITEQNLTTRQRQLAEEAKIIATGKTLRKEQAEVERELAASRARFAEAESRRNRSGRTTDPTDQIIGRLRQHIALNDEQAKSENKLTATERLLVQVRTELDKLGDKASASKRATVDALMAEARASGEAAEKALAEAKAKEALARQNAILQQQAQNRARSNEVDLLGYGRGEDVVEQQRRRLDIEREFEDELKRLGDRAVAEDQTTWDEMAANAARHRDEQLRLEDQYQQDRLQVMGDWRNGARRAFDDLQSRAADVAGRTNELFSSAFLSMEEAVVKFATTGKGSVKDLLSSIGADLVKFFASKAVMQFIGMFAGAFAGGGTAAPSTGFASSFGNNTGWLTTNAKGGVYQTPSLHQYANQVHDKPKLFAFAKGTGVFGEAGPEAIMPLTRTAGGQLGVRAVGGGGGSPITYIDVSIDSGGRSSSQVRGSEDSTGRELGKMIESAVNDVLIRQMQPGGLLYSGRPR